MFLVFNLQWMLSLEKCCKIDPQLKDLSEEEAIEIVEDLYGMAQLALENWLKSKSGSNNP